MKIPSDHLQSSSIRYLGVFGGVFMSILFLVVLTNYLTDPYLAHQWDTLLVKRSQPENEGKIPWGKTYAVYKYQPQVLYVGNSRTQTGLPARPEFFEGKRVFNAAILGGRIWHDIAMLNHATMTSELDAVVWGVDYWSFTPDQGNPDFDQELVARDNHYWLKRPILDLKATMSLEDFIQSVNLHLGRRQNVCRSSLAFYGQRDEACDTAKLTARGGLTKALKSDIQGFQEKNKKYRDAIPMFKTEIERLCAQKIRILMYINPTHALVLENFYQLGGEAEIEEWKRQIVSAVEAAAKRQCEIELFDFSGFNSITSESIPDGTGPMEMRNFWEGSHYRTAVGKQILAKIIPLKDIPVPSDFGVRLEQSNIAEHLARIRLERNLYRKAHPRELALLGEWFARNGQENVATNFAKIEANKQ